MPGRDFRRGINVSHQQMRLVGEYRRFQFRQSGDGLVAMTESLVQIFGPQRNPRQQQLRREALLCRVEGVERRQSLGGEPSGFKQTSFVIEDKGPIQVDQRRPRPVLFPDENLSRLGKELQAFKGVSLLAGGDG